MATSTNDLGWTAYTPHGIRLRVRDIYRHGAIEYELCSEGGQMLIRRLDYEGKTTVVSEACRGLARDTEAAWATLIRSLC
ncbi:hypothetical protein ACIBH1_47245 [Nonomuraea sp. NPDC050663]|uniref:hypothetical protein n=1 Tax=Nonomuraea sp. NPDC050663 TaxID=3364370 RepID=UPI003792B0B4